MRKQGALRSLLTVPVFLLFFLAGYFSMSAATARPAYAIGCGFCIPPGNGLSTAISRFGNDISAAVAVATAQIIAYFNVVMIQFSDTIGVETVVVATSINSWFDTFWDYNMLPSMQDVTEQETTVTQAMSQAKIQMTNADGENREEVKRQIDEVMAEQAVRPSEQLAIVSTIVGGLSRADVFSEAYNRAGATERAPRTGNTVGIPSATGKGADMNDRWNNYTNRYCDKDSNNGAAGCASNAPHAGADIDVGGGLFLRDTIELTDVDVRKNVDDLITNLAEPFAKNNVAAGAVASEQGQSAILASEAYRAKRQVIYDSIYHIVGRRAPGSRMGVHLTPIRIEAGIKPAMISLNPSYNEVMQVMMNERFRTGRFANLSLGDPENDTRELVVQQAFQLMDMSDQLDLMDRYSILLAAQAGADIRKDKPAGTAVSGAPLQ